MVGYTCLWTAKIIIKVSHLSRLICRFNMLLIKIPSKLFHRHWVADLQFLWRNKEEKEKEAGWLTVSSFETYCRATVKKSVWYVIRIDKWGKIESRNQFIQIWPTDFPQKNQDDSMEKG